jgi:hypothetical protein
MEALKAGETFSRRVSRLHDRQVGTIPGSARES